MGQDGRTSQRKRQRGWGWNRGLGLYQARQLPGAARARCAFLLSCSATIPNGDHFRLTRQVSWSPYQTCAIPEESLLIKSPVGLGASTGGKRI